MTHPVRTTVAAMLVALTVLTVPAGAAGAGAAEASAAGAHETGAADRLDPPQPPFLTEASPSSLTVGWEPSAGPVAGYTVRMQTGAQFEPVLSTTANHATLTGLEPFTAYNVDVVANAVPGSGLADSSPSRYGVFRTTYVPESEPPTAPGKPEVVELGTNLVRLRYASATDNLHVEQYVTQLLHEGAWTDIDPVAPPGTASPILHKAAHQSKNLSRLSGETTYTVAMVAIDLSGNRSPRSEPVIFTTKPFTAVPSCLIQISARRGDSFYRLVIDQSNTTPSAVDALPVTFALPIEHTPTASNPAAEAAELRREGAHAALSWSAGSRIEPGYVSRQLAFAVRHNGNPTLPDDFRLEGSPCTVTVSGNW